MVDPISQIRQFSSTLNSTFSKIRLHRAHKKHSSVKRLILVSKSKTLCSRYKIMCKSWDKEEDTTEYSTINTNNGSYPDYVTSYDTVRPGNKVGTMSILLVRHKKLHFANISLASLSWTSDVPVKLLLPSAPAITFWRIMLYTIQAWSRTSISTTMQQECERSQVVNLCVLETLCKETQRIDLHIN